MCLICVELQKNKLTSLEARDNLNEMRKSIEKDHRIEVLRLIWRKEDEEWQYSASEECLASEDLSDVGSD